MSMHFRLNLHADTPAFASDPTKEVARILRQEADRIEQGQVTPGFWEDNPKGWLYATIHDANGTDVGRHAFKPKECFE